MQVAVYSNGSSFVLRNAETVDWNLIKNGIIWRTMHKNKKTNKY